MANIEHLRGKVALITGASHPMGMGAAAARVLAAQGAHVICTDIGRDETIKDLKELIEQIGDAGGKASSAILDVTKTDNVQKIFAEVQSQHGGLDILFNNAGVGKGVGPFETLTDEEWQLLLDINVMGVVRCSRAAVPLLRKRNGGSIINNSSLAGLGAITEFSGYSASKFAVVGLTKAMAAELGASGIRVNAVCPGIIRTQMLADAYEHEVAVSGKSRDDVVDQFNDGTALRRAGEPSEVADVVAFLAGSSSSFISGAAIPVAGGLAPGL